MSNSDTMSGVGAGASQGAKSGSAIMPGVGTAIGAVFGGAVGGMLGASVGKKKKAYEKTFNQYMSELQALDMPRYEDLKLALERYTKGEDLTPEQLQTLQELDTEVSKLSYDKTAKQTQLDALAALKARSRGGLTLQDKADLMNAQKEIDRAQTGVQKSIVQNMQSRGVGGAGVELAQRMGAAQMGTQQASQNALNVAANAQNRAMQALKDSATMGRQIGQDQLDLDTTKAKSIDDMRRRNLERMQESMQYNVGARNNASMLNWNRANTTADSNVDLGNEEQKHNKKLLIEDYNNQINRISGKYGMQLDQDASKVEDSKRKMAGTLDAIGSLGNMFGSMGGSKK